MSKKTEALIDFWFVIDEPYAPLEGQFIEMFNYSLTK